MDIVGRWRLLGGCVFCLHGSRACGLTVGACSLQVKDAASGAMKGANVLGQTIAAAADHVSNEFYGYGNGWGTAARHRSSPA